VIAALGRLPAIGQIGLVVQDMTAAMVTYGAAFGVDRWYRSRMAWFEVVFDGEPIAIEWDIVVGYSGRVQIELIRVGDAGPNLYHEVFGPDGAGLHHLGLVVHDLDHHLESAEAADIAIRQHGAIRFAGGAACRFAYLDTAAELGLILELIEMRVYGLDLGMPEWLLRVGTLTGDVERLHPSRM
jgi:hypothetical protein